ncbi:MAG TPA: IclR family transcriptional regulator [Actinomycetota bacterium]|nr:IclR family transcriptional regulator [Actinomycetota bacterium]
MEGSTTRDREGDGGLGSAPARSAPATAVGTLDRVVDILNAVEAGARSYTDITRATGLSRPTAHRLIRALEQHGFLVQAGAGYAIGPRLLGLASSAMRELPLRDLAHPSLERLAKTTGESAQLFVRDDDVRICVDAVESVSELRTIVDVGAILPLTRGSAGKVLLSWAPERDRRRILGSLPPDEASRLTRTIATTVRRGWADSIGEREPGVASVSAPVFDAAGALIAAISVSGPADRIGALRGRRYAPAVTAAAREVEATLGVAST